MTLYSLAFNFCLFANYLYVLSSGRWYFMSCVDFAANEVKGLITENRFIFEKCAASLRTREEQLNTSVIHMRVHVWL